ncbi:MAG: hypothetical protein ABI610_00075 [Acidobacteriota bacterium]
MTSRALGRPLRPASVMRRATVWRATVLTVSLLAAGCGSGTLDPRGADQAATYTTDHRPAASIQTPEARNPPPGSISRRGSSGRST